VFSLLIAGIVFGCAAPPRTAEQSGNQQSYQDGAYPAFDPVVLSPDLRTSIDAAVPGEFVSVIVRLKSSADLNSEPTFTSATSKATQRDAAISYLQEFAANSQFNLLQAARELEADGLVRDIRPLWIANAICLDVTKEGITYLTEYQDIEYIAGSAKLPIFLADTPWNVDHVNSPQVWERAAGAIRGSGVVVAVIDSGVDLSHPDLDDRIWINPAEDLDGDGRLSRQDVNGIDDDGNGWVDDVAGWDFEAGDNDPSPNLFESGRDGGHGTHIAGIIAGDGGAGLATGVSPGADLMVLKINSQVSVWQAMEYALENGADIINLSLGWPQSMFPDAATWRDAIDHATDAGVLVVTAAGNGGSAPMVHAIAPDDITLPGRVPRALTVSPVAAPSDSDWLDPIATFSAAGPVSWQSVRGYQDYPYPPGLMKPDLTAPGINIHSTAPGGGYDVKSGSSMAAAHVSGAAALLLESSPTMQPHEIMYQLRETAWRFTDPNDVRGWGRLDAFSAINYKHEWSSYDLVVDAADVTWQNSSIWIDNNNDGIHDDPIPGGTNRVFARVRNQGGQSVGNTELRFYYAPAGTLGASSLAGENARDAFHYIGSYHIPVTGPAGSSQDTFTGAVEWLTPQTGGHIGHWTIAVEAVAASPMNSVETITDNNSALRNAFEIVLAPGQTTVFGFNIYIDAQHPRAPLNLEFIRSGSAENFSFEFSLPQNESPVTYTGLTGLSVTDAEGIPAMPLQSDRARVEGIQLAGGLPVTARLQIRAPDVDDVSLSQEDSMPTRITINARNEFGLVGGVTVDVRLDPDAAKLNRLIYAQK